MTATQPFDIKATPSNWHSLKPEWEGGQEVIRRGLPHHKLSPTWQMLLLGDGSPTHLLQLLTGEKTEVDVIDMSLIGKHDDGAPVEIDAIAEPRLRRQVWLRTESGQRLAYAASWWNASSVDDYLHNRSQPIWRSLSTLHTELYRDVRGIQYGHCSALESEFGQQAPLWGRYYLFWHNSQPLTLIYEVFSPYLQKYLGEMTREQ